LLTVFFGLTLPAQAETYSITAIGSLGGTFVDAIAINKRGQVTGQSTTTGDTVTHAFLYSNGTTTDLGTLSGLGSQGFAINDRGQVTGLACFASGCRAFLYSNGVMTDLGTLGGPNSNPGASTHQAGQSINNVGQVVGISDPSPGDTIDVKVIDVPDLVRDKPDQVEAVGYKTSRESRQVETIQVHHLVPGRHEVTDELLLHI
jgi:probable HAF family extracellular repeat protein